MIAFSFLFATPPQKRVKARFLPFESGVSEGAPTKQRFTVSFYLTAMLFILFDIEVIFIYLWALVFRDLLVGGLVSMLIFVGVLLLGLAYAWRKGVLTWR